MKETGSTQKVCSFYVSNMHFATMILPFVNKQIEEKTPIITFFETDFTTNIELVLSKLLISEERKKELLNINWKQSINQTKYINLEKSLKNQINKKGKNIIIINGNTNYINIINEELDRFAEKFNKKIEKNSIKIINFFEVREFQR